MNISVFGLGYVGCVGIGCLARNGHNVIGVDISKEKVALINSGKATIVEKDIDGLIKSGHENSSIRATEDYLEAVAYSDISFICVGTPSTEEGHLNLEYIFQTADEIGRAIKRKNTFHVVVVRSTVLPGTNEQICKIIENISGKKCNEDFAVVSNPEFLREGTAVNDYLNPPLTVLGSTSDKAIDIMRELYSHTKSSVEVVDVKVAEILKYVNNTYHALKIVFANEVGDICKKSRIDSHEVMRVFCLDKQLNISPYYFKPGFAYGGSCLPKDLKALKTMAHDYYIRTPLINSISDSNDIHVEKAIELVEKAGKSKIAFMGLSFKAGTDDMRNSPIIKVIEHFIGKGYAVKIFDKNVNVSRLIGRNKSVIIEKLPHLNSLLTDDLSSIVQWADVLVIANKEDDYRHIDVRDGQKIVDLVRIPELEVKTGYSGICW